MNTYLDKSHLSGGTMTGAEKLKSLGAQTRTINITPIYCTLTPNTSQKKAADAQGGGDQCVAGRFEQSGRRVVVNTGVATERR